MDSQTLFGMDEAQLLDVISSRFRLMNAVRGGVAEAHLLLALAADPAVASAEPIDLDGQPDARITLHDGTALLVECKNAARECYADGSPRVEVQKTRASKNDPLSRFYRPEQFDVLAVCLHAPTGEWAFAFAYSHDLDGHAEHTDRIRPMQRVDARYAPSLSALLA